MNFHFPLGRTVVKLSEINWKQAQKVQVILIYNFSGVIQSKAMVISKQCKTLSL
jgi:hypothetical protein